MLEIPGGCELSCRDKPCQGEFYPIHVIWLLQNVRLMEASRNALSSVAGCKQERNVAATKCVSYREAVGSAQRDIEDSNVDTFTRGRKETIVEDLAIKTR